MERPSKKITELKPLFLERIQKLLPDKKDLQEYLERLKIDPVRSIRCNKLKVSPENLKTKLEKRGWKISQPFKNYPEVMIIESELFPGELGRSLEHLLGYYYIQETASMLPIIALKPLQKEKILDLCASPGSKTTQTAAELQNTGLIIANEPQMSRLQVLASNLERCGVTNTIITRKDGRSLCRDLNITFDKILVDAPCSGEGTLRSSPKTYLMWNIKTIKNLPKIQQRLFTEAFEKLKVGGEIIYSTCTHAPEENEGVVNFLLENLKDKIEILDVKKDLPVELKTRPGITSWEEETYNQKVKLCVRIYPHDNNTEGFFIAKFRRVK